MKKLLALLVALTMVLCSVAFAVDEGTTEPSTTAPDAIVENGDDPAEGATDPATDPAEGTTDPATDPAEGTTDPATDPAEGTTDPATDPAEGTTDPATDPAEGTTDPATDPAEGTTDPAPVEPGDDAYPEDVDPNDGHTHVWDYYYGDMDGWYEYMPWDEENHVLTVYTEYQKVCQICGRIEYVTDTDEYLEPHFDDDGDGVCDAASPLGAGMEGSCGHVASNMGTSEDIPECGHEHVVQENYQESTNIQYSLGGESLGADGHYVLTTHIFDELCEDCGAHWDHDFSTMTIEPHTFDENGVCVCGYKQEVAPSDEPTEEPTATPTAEPTATPTAPEVTATPTAPEVTATPTAPEVTATPTAEPTATPIAPVEPGDDAYHEDVDPDDGHVHNYELYIGSMDGYEEYMPWDAQTHIHTVYTEYELACSICGRDEYFYNTDEYVENHFDNDGDGLCDACEYAGDNMGTSEDLTSCAHEHVVQENYQESTNIQYSVGGESLGADGHYVLTSHFFDELCEDCGAHWDREFSTMTIEPHTFDKNGVCVCGYKKAATQTSTNMPKTGDTAASAATLGLLAAACFFGFCAVRKQRVGK